MRKQQLPYPMLAGRFELRVVVRKKHLPQSFGQLRRAAWRILGATGLAWASFLRAVEHVDSGVRRDAIVGLRPWGRAGGCRGRYERSKGHCY